MTDHPSTFKAAQTGSSGTDWDDGASIHRGGDGQGVLDSMKALHRGTLAEMVQVISDMPEEERRDFVIQKAGDRQLGADDIMALANRPDFPRR